MTRGCSIRQRQGERQVSYFDLVISQEQMSGRLIPERPPYCPTDSYGYVLR